MHRCSLHAAWITACLVLVAGCAVEDRGVAPGTPEGPGQPELLFGVVPEPCGTVTTMPLCVENEVIGTVTVANDEDDVCATFETSGAWFLDTVYLTLQTATLDVPANGERPEDFILTFDTGELSQSQEVCASLSDLGLEPGAVAFVLARADVSFFEGVRLAKEAVAWANGCGAATNIVPHFRHTIQICPPPCALSGFRTYTQADWGAGPESPAGAFLADRFSTCFPTGIMVGCTSGGGFMVTVTSPKAVTELLPAGGTAAALVRDYVDPSCDGPGCQATEAGTFLGAVMALGFNILFDICDPLFSTTQVPLFTLDVNDADSPFDGWPVANVFFAANEMLGDCYAGPHSIEDMLDCVTRINGAFVDGAPAVDCYLQP